MDTVDLDAIELPVGAALRTVPGVLANVSLSPTSGRGVIPKIEDSLGPFLAREDGAGVAPAVPLTPSFRLIYEILW